MPWWRTSIDRDVVAAAQRRLAALPQSADDPPPDGRVAPPSGPAPAHERAALDGGLPRPPAPRHAAERPRAETGLWGLSAQHVTVAALLVVALVVAAAWWALRSVPQTHPVQVTSERLMPSTQTPGPPSSPAHPASSNSAGDGAVGGSGPPTAGARLVIDVAGKVRHPGIVELPAGSRVVDAIAAAGGARPGVSLTSLNLARLLVDGEQIVVGVEIPFGGATGGSSAGQATGSPASISPVNLNTATAEELDTLPDIGPVTAQAILQWRADNGPFSSIDELLEVSGIGTATLADVRPYVFV
jgi:competence protein ComEA